MPKKERISGDGAEHQGTSKDQLAREVELSGDDTGKDRLAHSELEEANEKANEYRDLAQRTQADFINYKRRLEQEREEKRKFAALDLIAKLLPILDDLQMAFQAVPSEDRDSNWVNGITLIERKLMTILNGEGLSRIEAEGEDFNPWEHEALAYEEEVDHDEGKVKAVVREGYKLHDRVLRPAHVVVTKKKNVD